MNRDDILRMAREAEGEEELHGMWSMHVEDLERFADLVAAAEREACARVCEVEATQWRGRDSDAYAAVWDCVHAILKRGA